VKKQVSQQAKEDGFFAPDRVVPVTTKIPPRLRQQFKMLVIAHNTSIQDVLEDFIEKWVESHSG
jgi:hypothetical protein